jgi:hypothetical protein
LLLDGDVVAGLWDALAHQVKSHDYTLERGDCSGANGLTDHEARTVRVRSDVSEAQACKTVAHEIAHVILHPDAKVYRRCRGRSEVEAESVAYLVCRSAGLETEGYSFPYVARWADGKAGVSEDHLYRIEKGLRRTRQSTLVRIVDAICEMASRLGDPEHHVVGLVPLAGPALAPEALPEHQDHIDRRRHTRIRQKTTKREDWIPMFTRFASSGTKELPF